MYFYDQKFELRYQDKINVKFSCDGSYDNLQNYIKNPISQFLGFSPTLKIQKGWGSGD